MLIVDMSNVFEAAQTYVMLSRVQELQQVIIIDCVYKEKIYPSSQAMNELDNMNAKSMNLRVTQGPLDLNLVSLNIRSLSKHVFSRMKILKAMKLKDIKVISIVLVKVKVLQFTIKKNIAMLLTLLLQIIKYLNLNRQPVCGRDGALTP